MKKLGSTLLLLSAFCFITACEYSDENPQKTVGSAAKALNSDDTQKFLNLLTGPARAEYQNPAAVEALQQHIDQFRKLSVASETLIGENVVSSNKTFRTYALKVTDSKGRHALDVQVKCQLDYGTYADSFDHLLRARLLRDRPGRPPAEDSDAVTNGGGSNDDRPERPQRPDRPDEHPDYEPNEPSRPSMSWHQACRIQSIRK